MKKRGTFAHALDTPLWRMLWIYIEGKFCTMKDILLAINYHLFIASAVKVTEGDFCGRRGFRLDRANK